MMERMNFLEFPFFTWMIRCRCFYAEPRHDNKFKEKVTGDCFYGNSVRPRCVYFEEIES